MIRHQGINAQLASSGDATDSSGMVKSQWLLQGVILSGKFRILLTEGSHLHVLQLWDENSEFSLLIKYIIHTFPQ